MNLIYNQRSFGNILKLKIKKLIMELT